MKRNHFPLLLLLLLAAFLGACGAGGPPTINPAEVEAVYTQAAQTLALGLTMQAGQQAVERLTQIAQYTPTPSPAPPTRTPEPPSPTPTITQSPTITPDASCNRAAFLEDVTVEPGTAFLPGSSFTKTWRIQNTGSCAWTGEYALVFFEGEALGGPERVTLEGVVRPGDIVDLSVHFIAPEREEVYTGTWMLRSASGDLFGVGPQASDSLVVEIRTRVPDETAFNFSHNYCNAFWSTAAGQIGCPGFDANTETGFVNQYDSPVLENGRAENEPAIITYPNSGPGGRISGRYPAFRVRQGDRFRTVVGCFFDSSSCNVVFQLNYSVDGGPIRNLDTWTEWYDGEFTRVDLDLSPLAGRSVEFILTVLNNGDSRDDWAFWLMPVIVR